MGESESLGRVWRGWLPRLSSVATNRPPDPRVGGQLPRQQFGPDRSGAVDRATPRGALMIVERLQRPYAGAGPAAGSPGWIDVLR